MKSQEQVSRKADMLFSVVKHNIRAGTRLETAFLKDDLELSKNGETQQ